MLEWPHKQVWNKNCCAPLDAAALMGSRSISHPAFSFRFFYFSSFLKSFPFRWGTAAARPSVSGERNEEERAERSRLTIEGKRENEGRGEKKFVSAQSLLDHPWLVKETVGSRITSPTQMALPHR